MAGNGALAHHYTNIAIICIVLPMLIFAKPLSILLTESDASANLLRFAIYCICFTVPFSILVQSRISYLQAIEYVRQARQLSLAANLIFLVPCACIYVALFGVRGVFMAFPTAQILALLISWIVHIKRSKRILPEASDYLEADNDFFKNPGDIISYPIETKDDCALISEQIVLFCHGHKIDERKCFLAGVCAEELAINALKHGLVNQKRLKTADIRVVIDVGDIIIRLRDSGSAFNLKSFSNQLENEDASNSKTGIRLILHSAKSINYYRTYGMNTTIIRV